MKKDLSFVEMPPYNFSNPHLWFHMCESTFSICHPKPITESLVKYNHIVANLPPKAAVIVRDIILDPDKEDPYHHIKSELISRTEESLQEKMKKLLVGIDLRGRRPSELLHVMQRRASSHNVPEKIIIELFVQRMPPKVQSILSVVSPLTLEKAAEISDRIFEVIPIPGIIVSKKELLGLLIVFIGYVLLGGLVFMLLESPLEEKLRREIEDLRTEFQDKLNRLGDPNVTKADMEALMLRLSAAHRMSLIDEAGNDTHSNWSFGNSFFFAITVVTTIGYGHLSPSTTGGRLFCVLYATIGIPLTGIVLAAIGGHYSQRLVKGIQRARKDRNSRLAQSLSAAKCLIPWMLVFLVVPAGFFVWFEDWSFVDSFYYCFITLSTIGFGDFVAGNFEGDYVGVYKTFVVLWIIFGLGYLAMILNYISRMMRCKQIRKVERKLSTSIYLTQQRMGQRLDEVYQIISDVSRTRTIKPRSRAALKRMQSFPAPELKDRNHNNKIHKILTLVQAVKEEEPPPVRPRRLSLPLPVSPGLQSANFGRGSLQVFSSSALNGPAQPRLNKMGNGYHLKPSKHITLAPSDLEINRDASNVEPSHNVKNDEDRVRIRRPSIAVIDVISAEIPSLNVTSAPNPRTIIDMEGLQCTEV